MSTPTSFAAGAKPDNVNEEEWNQLQGELAAMRGKVDASEYGRPLHAGELETLDESNLGNDAALEMQWAIKAGQHAETYFNLMSSLTQEQRSNLRLTKIDDEIHKDFRMRFPNLDLHKLNMKDLKSDLTHWRAFLSDYEERVPDWNFATLLRMDASTEYGPYNAEVVPRVQFLAIEIARNREGANRF